MKSISPYIRSSPFPTRSNQTGKTRTISVVWGQDTPMIVDADEVFGTIDSRFRQWNLTSPEPGNGTTTLARHRIIRDFTAKELLASVSRIFGKICVSLTTRQVTALVKSHGDRLVALPRSTYVPIKAFNKGQMAYYLARICRHRRGRPDIYVYNMEDEDIWSSELHPHLLLPSYVRA